MNQESIFIGVVCLTFEDGTPPRFYWYAVEEPADMDQAAAIASAKLPGHGPFDTEDEALEAATREVCALLDQSTLQ
jgi:hypothetical protein